MTIAEIDVSGYISVPEDCENGQTSGECFNFAAIWGNAELLPSIHFYQYP